MGSLAVLTMLAVLMAVLAAGKGVRVSGEVAGGEGWGRGGEGG